MEFDHGIQIPSDEEARVHFVDGELADPAGSVEHLRLLQALRETDRLGLRKLFHTLEPPQMDCLVGEYDAELLSQGGPISRLVTGRAFGIHGDWFGKAFYAISDSKGVGYNCFRSSDVVLRKLHMDTAIRTSTMDSGRSLMIRYHAKNKGIIRWLYGEIRQITPNVMLGIGVFGPRIGRRDICRRKIPFVLVGPCRDYQPDHAMKSQRVKQAA